mgnify:CR=1 FL=1
MITRTLRLAALLSLAAAPAAGQSLYNAAGLGVPVEALDARARALGSLGIGLRGGSFMPTDPGALGRLSYSTGVMVAQPSWTDFSSPAGATGKVQGTRFPLLGIAYPIIGGMASVQIGSVLDQSFEAESISEVDFGRGPVTTTDTFQQDGSISTLNLGFARSVTDWLSAGVTVGRYAGSVDRVLTRSFEEEETDDVDTYVEAGTWSYSAWALTAGVAVDALENVRVAASIHLPGDLDAEASAETRGADRSYALPTQLRLGASVTLMPALVVTGSVQLADWESTGADLIDGSYAGSQNGFGLGVELTQATFFGKNAPLRLGFREVGLPFAFLEQGGTERSFSGGFGLELSRQGNVVLAGVDVAIERGLRFGGGVREEFWRATISLLASGL